LKTAEKWKLRLQKLANQSEVNILNLFQNKVKEFFHPKTEIRFYVFKVIKNFKAICA
jgi:hypothetical protein